MQKPITAEEALNLLKEGNKRFVSGNLKNKYFSERRKETKDAQYPHSVVLSCIDSRSAAEQFFDTTIGEIFNIRVAGNVLNQDVLGSMEFATRIAGSKLIAVIGHSNCGGVKGAIGNVDIGHVATLVEDIKPAMSQVSEEAGEPSASNKKYVKAVTDRHIANVVERIPNESDIIRKQVEAGEVKIVGGIHDLESGRVTFFE